MTDTAFVTSHLVVGDTPTGVAGPFLHTTDVQDAVDAIDQGATVVLPSGSWELAGLVLKAFGASARHIDFQIRVAKGEVDPGEGTF